MPKRSIGYRVISNKAVLEIGWRMREIGQSLGIDFGGVLYLFGVPMMVILFVLGLFRSWRSFVGKRFRIFISIL